MNALSQLFGRSSSRAASLRIDKTFNLIPAKSLHVSKPIDWLESRFHFNFAGYWDENKQNFGVLRVLNDDLVTPRGGFPTHPHRDMEIISYVVQGGLTHKDSMGTQETLGRGSVQYMSAGTGVRHSEFNASDSETLRFLQLWISPNQRGLKPNYGSKSFKPEDRLNRVLHLVSGNHEKHPDTIAIYQDANIFVSEIEEGKTVTFNLEEGRQAYLVCVEGDLDINGKAQLAAKDAVEITGPSELVFTNLNRQSGVKAHFLMVEMKEAVSNTE